MQTIAIDTETFLIGPGEVIPKLVCMSAAWRSTNGMIIESSLHGNGDDDLHAVFASLLAADDVRMVFHNAAYDLNVLARAFPDLTSLIWAKLAEGSLVTDTGIRERLHNNSTIGRLTERELPDGSFQHLEYRLKDLALRHLGIDLSMVKDTTITDNWRMNYHTLDGMKAADYPDDARAYAMDDAIHTLEIYEKQALLIGDREKGPGSVHGEYFKTAQDFALLIITARGMRTDPHERARLEAWVAEELADDKLDLLVEAKVLRPAQPSHPHANAKKRVAELFNISVEAAEQDIKSGKWTEAELERCREASIATTAGKKASINKKMLHALVEEVCRGNNFEVKRTEPSATHPEGSVSTDEKVMSKLAPHSPVLAQYKHRQGMQQIANTELPRMQARVVHFRYNVIVSSFRTSSSGGDRKTQLYPATNGQNVNPRVRRAYIPRDGNVFCSADYDRLELCTLAQKNYDLFGFSVMRDMINAGMDLHSYLGAQIALHLHPEFGKAVESIKSDPLKVYEAFMLLKYSDDPDQRAIYDKYRKFAKPTGLGYPGGLGAETMVTYAAKKAYGVIIDKATAELLKDIWFDTFPEMRQYFKWVNENCKDPDNVGAIDDRTNKPKGRYCYYTPLDHYRAGCAYTEAANGAGMQSPAADGFGIAIFNAVRACNDPAFGSVLYGAHIVNEIHDELIGEWEDDERSSLRALELSNIMEESMRQVVPDVKIGVSPALMRRWDKRAKPVYDETSGALLVWEPSDAC